MPELTHFDEHGASRMVDTSGAEVGTVDAVELVTVGQRRGLGGGGGGRRFALSVNVADRVVTVGTLDDLRNDAGEVVATFVCPDTTLPYPDKYSTHLEPSDF